MVVTFSSAWEQAVVFLPGLDTFPGTWDNNFTESGSDAHVAEALSEASATWGAQRMRLVMALFCVGVVVAFGRTLPGLLRYYSWFNDSGLDMAKYRGFGQTACRAYGILPAPKLPVAVHSFFGYSLLFCLTFVSAVPLAFGTFRIVLLGSALVLYFLFFSQIYSEAHTGAHVTVLIPPALVLLMTTSAMDSGLDEATAAQGAVLTAFLMKVVVTSAYCGAGWEKIAKSYKGGKWWVSGTTMQACILEGLFTSSPDWHTSFGVPTPFSHYIQRFIVQFPTLLCMPASIFAVGFEFLSPIVLLLNPNPASIIYTAIGIKFHYGIALMQNIDFVTWWGPAYAFFALDPAAAYPLNNGAPSILDCIFSSYEAAPWRTIIAVGYVVLHLTAIVLLRFTDVEFLPFSAFMMYSKVRDVFDRTIRDTVYFSEKPHATGTIKNYSFPFCRPQVVKREELDQLSFRHLIMRHGGIDAAGGELQPVEVMTNVVLTPELTKALEDYRKLTTEESPEDAKESAKSPMQRARRLTEAIMTGRRAFREAPRRPMKLPSNKMEKVEKISWDHEYTSDELREMEVIVFDGVCNLCNGAMQFVDSWAEDSVRLGWMQNERTLKYLDEFGIDKEDINKSFAFIKQGQVYRGSTAACKIMGKMAGPFPAIGSVAILVPACIRDAVYAFVARNRYTMFGKSDACKRPAKSLMRRFIHQP